MSTTQTTNTTPKMPVRNGSRSCFALLDKGAPPLAGIHLATERKQDVAAGRTVDLDRHRAEVDVEERAVGAERRKPQVVLAELLDVVVHLGLAVVQLGGQRAGVLQDALQRPARILQQLSQIRRCRRQRT